MSGFMRPDGVKVMVAGKEYHFLFTLSAIYEIENYYDEPLSSVIKKLSNERSFYDAVWNIITALIQDEERYSGLEKISTKDEIGMNVSKAEVNSGEITRAILKAYGYDFPEGDEEEDPNVSRSLSDSTSQDSSTSVRSSSATRRRKSSE